MSSEEGLWMIIEGKSYRGKRLQKALIVKILKEAGPLNGYEITKVLNDLKVKSSPSSVYNLLKEMVREGVLKLENGKYTVATEVLIDPYAEVALRVIETLSNDEIQEFLRITLLALKKLENVDEKSKEYIIKKLRECTEELRKLIVEFV